ncbi:MULTISPECIES: hypothetical protein [Paenibacillus]|uniref:DUF2207 domain-containing protein n=1 Tax=Paenibacillus borealis TaxID=160799 RepID=A0ABX3HT24_PAEBO|nr:MULTISPECIES: hypothetical protein [Paenibacillus]AIQ19621.1 hypothetical protein H70357_25095 [Paenibacillus sp. FSL H7-0357]OMD53656.1 hypothetical protein BSK56_00475 [Paenibacillus borealis]
MRHALIFWISVSLAVLGLVTGMLSDVFGTLSVFIFPLVLFGLLYYGYKMTPAGKTRTPGRPRTKVKPSQKTMSKVAGVRKAQTAPGKRKSYPFQVIEGSKGKSDDQLPKYH